MGNAVEGVHAVEVEHFVAQVRRDAVAIPVHVCQAASSEDGCIAVAEVRKSGQTCGKVCGPGVIEPHGSVEIFALIRVAKCFVGTVQDAHLIHEPIAEGASPHLNACFCDRVVERGGVG